MPVILRESGWRIVIWFNDHGEPHIHAFKAESSVKVEIETLKVLKVTGAKPKEVKQVQQIVENNQTFLLQEWMKIHS